MPTQVCGGGRDSGVADAGEDTYVAISFHVKLHDRVQWLDFYITAMQTFGIWAAKFKQKLGQYFFTLRVEPINRMTILFNAKK